MTEAIILSNILVPFGVAIVAAMAGPRWRHRFDPWVALLAVGAAVLTVVKVAGLGVPVRIGLAGWRAPLGIELLADGLGVSMVAITAMVGAAVTMFARDYFGAASREGRMQFFWPLWYFMWAALNALFLSSDIFNIYVTLELINLAAVALVALPRTRPALQAALRYLLVAFLGSLSYLFGVAWLYSATGLLELSSLTVALVPGPPLYIAAGLVLLGLMIKSALFPMHFWLPPAHANAPAPVSALLSGLVVTASLYLLVRFGFTLFAPLMSAWATPLGWLGGMAIIWGSVMALLQARLKMVIAYSTVAQLGYVFLLFPLATRPGSAMQAAWLGGIYFALCHACAKASAFLCAGAAMYAVGHDRLKDLRGAARKMPMVFFAFALAGVNLMGLPPSGGFMAKWLLLRSALESGLWPVVAVIVIGSLLAAAYIFRVVEVVFSNKEGVVCRHRPTAWMRGTALALAVVSILLGTFSRAPLDFLMIGFPGGTP